MNTTPPIVPAMMMIFFDDLWEVDRVGEGDGGVEAVPMGLAVSEALCTLIAPISALSALTWLVPSNVELGGPSQAFPKTLLPFAVARSTTALN
jgi:hypothetical protein